MYELHLKNARLQSWIQEYIKLCQPDRVHLCNGSKEEYDTLCNELVQAEVFTPLNSVERPGSFWCRSDPSDVARTEASTFICTKNEKDAGPTNNWADPQKMRAKLMSLFKGCMRGRTLYIIPFCMGPLNSPLAKLAVQITDSPYAVVNMRIMTRMGSAILQKLELGADFIPCLHSVGVPLEQGEKDSFWPCRHDEKYIVHFPETHEIFSFGSGYGGNALLGKKCLALRIASYLGKKEKWLAEHMLIMAVTSPEGEKKYFAAAFPSSCGKTNLALMKPNLPGWKVECLGDDIAWMKRGADGRLHGLNPEAGFFGVAPGTSYTSNPYAMETIAKNTIFTNVALTEERDVWWEGMTPNPPEKLIDWHGEIWTKDSKEPAAHPNARFTAPTIQCPILDPDWELATGVPISAIIVGGRRPSTIPLVTEAFSWQHGVFMAASISSETTAAAVGEVGKLRRDPFAMTPFCGYHMGDYFQHWLDIGAGISKEVQPRFFSVNWFRKDKESHYLWPGFGDNIRVLKWIFERVSGADNAIETPIGWMPKELDLHGLKIDPKAVKELLTISKKEYLQEVDNLREYFSIFANRFPKKLQDELDALHKRLKTSHS